MTETPAPAASTRSILVVDDETNVRWSLARALELQGYRVSTADSGETALEALAQRHFDLVITDIRMPGMDGFDLFNWLKENRPDVAVIMTTGFGSVHVRERSRRIGALTYMEKPLDLDTLCDFINQLFKPPRFAGRIVDIDLLDYLQLLSTTRKTKTVLVTRSEAVGRLTFEAGRLIHAECGDLIGVPAFHEMMCWEGGTFTDLPFEPPPRRSITDNTSYLLMEAARLRDERLQGASEDSPPGADSTGSTDSSRPVEDELEEETPESEQTFSQIRARYQSFLDRLTEQAGVEAAVLVSREGLTFARSGPVPPGSDDLVLVLRNGLGRVGTALGLDAGSAATVHEASGRALHVRVAGMYLLGVWLESGADREAVVHWIEEQNLDLG